MENARSIWKVERSTWKSEDDICKSQESYGKNKSRKKQKTYGKIRA